MSYPSGNIVAFRPSVSQSRWLARTLEDANGDINFAFLQAFAASRALPSDPRPLVLAAIYAAVLGRERLTSLLTRRVAALAPYDEEILGLCGAALYIVGRSAEALIYLNNSSANDDREIDID